MFKTLKSVLIIVSRYRYELWLKIDSLNKNINKIIAFFVFVSIVFYDMQYISLSSSFKLN